MKPKLLSTMKNYSFSLLKNDVKAGIIVAIISLPLSIAFALGSGVSAEKGIYSSIISSIIIGLLGGSRVQITGPTGAFIIIIQTTISKYGLEGLMITTVLAGLILIIMGILKLGKLIKYIPTPIVTGFTGGIAITIFTLEIKGFLGLTLTNLPSNFYGKWYTYINHISSINVTSLLLGILSLIILILWPKINKVIPGSLVTIIIVTFISEVFHLKTETLGYIDTNLSIDLVPIESIAQVLDMLQPALTVAILIAMQALLSAVVTDDLIQSKHKPNVELIAQGTANIVLGIFGCIPATGGVARSIANAKNGGRTPVAAIVHGITLFLCLILFMPIIKLIPKSVLSAIILQLSFNMFNVKAFLSYKHAPKSDAIILITSCFLTFSLNLIVAIEVGMVLSCILFMKRMSEEAHITQWEYCPTTNSINVDITEINQKNESRKSLKSVPNGTLVYEINGPLFFATANNMQDLLESTSQETKYIILRMSNVTAMDMSAIHVFKKIHQKLQKKGITLILSHVTEQPLAVMDKIGLTKEIGHDNICPNIDYALKRVNYI
jgi:SulP family sulfate permease